jgi:hypothetical protein
MVADEPTACPECHAANPWIYENDEYNCRQCGHVRAGDIGAKFRDEGEYVQPLTEIYFKNPVYRDSVTDRPLSAHLQKVEVSLAASSPSKLIVSAVRPLSTSPRMRPQHTESTRKRRPASMEHPRHCAEEAIQTQDYSVR